MGRCLEKFQWRLSSFVDRSLSTLPIEALIRYPKGIHCVDIAANVCKSSEKELPVTTLHEEFIQAINKFIYKLMPTIMIAPFVRTTMILASSSSYPGDVYGSRCETLLKYPAKDSPTAIFVTSEANNRIVLRDLFHFNLLPGNY